MLAQSDLDLGSVDDKDLSIVTRPVWLARVWVDPLAVWLCGPGQYSRMGGSQKGLETAVWTQFSVHTLPWGVSSRSWASCHWSDVPLAREHAGLVQSPRSLQVVLAVHCDPGALSTASVHNINMLIRGETLHTHWTFH